MSNRLQVALASVAVFSLVLQACGGGPPSRAPRLSSPAPEVTPSRLSPEQAIAAAVNTLTPLPDGFSLRNPRDIADFTSSGLRFQPRRAGPEWDWRLAFVGAGDTPLASVNVRPIEP